MATLALAAAGAAVGSALLPSGMTVLGATLSGAAIGSQIGALTGNVVDNALFASSGRTRSVEGPRLRDLRVTASTEGAAVQRIYGRVRVGGQVIWATDFDEQVVQSTTSGNGGGGAKGLGGGGGAGNGGGTTTTTEYRYFANFAVALCEGPISGIGRVWADGRELDLSRATYRLYLGDELQNPDSLIVSRLGGGTPAYRGIAYIVFERLAVGQFGNRLPQLSFEVFRAVDEFSSAVHGVCMIPGSGEFVYATQAVTRVAAGGVSEPENVNTSQGGADWSVSLEQLEATLPNATAVNLIVSWFGDDLRAGHCQLKPGVEISAKSNRPLTWGVAGLTRTSAHLTSQQDGRPAYGGTPSDNTVVAAIQDLKARNKQVVLTPFILMDVPQDNALSDPYSVAATQPSYPWRGRITCDPAPGRPGSPDKSATAAAQIDAFLGSALPSHYAISGTNVVYSGPTDWQYRRFILHYAYLAKAAGGVDAFVIGSEMRGLTHVRSATSTYPFVAALVQLAAEVKTILGPSCKVTYAADWSEYYGHQPQDGTGDVYFHLDPLWSSSSIDAIGIDIYWPLADWREGSAHQDYVAGARSIYELAYLKGNLRGGEGFDWYYASPAARDAQMRSPITDGAGKPWVYRYKDIRGWWESHHYDRPGGAEATIPTAWVPQSKPFWFMEFGCPAVDKGANQPNVFVDAKSSETALPHYSRGGRDDLMQRRYLQAMHEGLDPAHPGAVAGANPISSVYGGHMVDLDRVFVYAWDARPYPAFPLNETLWGDTANWRLGHWLNGRFAGAPLAEMVGTILDDHGFGDHDADTLNGTIAGYTIDRIMSARDALESLELAHFFDPLESEGRIVFRHRGAQAPVMTLTEGNLVEIKKDAALITLTRAQETDLPASAKITYLSGSGDYRQSVAESRRLTGGSGRVAQAELAMVLEPHQAAAIADAWLFESWACRERAEFALPPSALRVEPGDIVEIVIGHRNQLVRITEIGDHGIRECRALSIDPEIYGSVRVTERPVTPDTPDFVGQPAVYFLDLPLLRGDEPAEAGYFAAHQLPWPGGVALYRSPEATGYVLKAIASAPAAMGETLDPLPPGPAGRIDKSARFRVKLFSGELESVTRLQLLAGANAAAIRNADGDWEVVQFESAVLVEPRTYELSLLLRGQGGTEGAMRESVATGARFVLIDGAIARADMTINDMRLPFNYKAGPSSRDIGDESFITETHTFTGLGLRPLSPAHLKGKRIGSDIHVSWIRRTRLGGDSWETADVPLAEQTEVYEMDILDGAAVRRTITTTSPAVVYTADQQVADFGAPQSSLSIRVHQMSTVYGRGAPASSIV